MSVAIYSPKGKKFRGRAVIASTDERGQSIVLSDPIPSGVRRGDMMVITQGPLIPIWPVTPKIDLGLERK